MDTTQATEPGMRGPGMQGDPAMEGGQIQMQDGDDFVCSNCGCEIRLVHHGDPAKMPNMQPFTCCCGTRMEKEQHGG